MADIHKTLEAGSFISRELSERPSAFQLISWNIARGSKLHAIIEFLASADADLIFLQEVDTNARRTNRRNIAREIAQQLRMNYVFGWEFEELAQGSTTSPAYHGQATLSRYPVSGSRILRFRNQSKFWNPYWFTPSLGPLQRRSGGRMALMSEVQFLNGSLVTYNLHFESKGDDDLRQTQLDELLEDVGRHNMLTPIVAAGDFNFDISKTQVTNAIARSGLVNPFAPLSVPTPTTHSAFSAGRALDWILLGGPLKALNPQIHSSVTASDHYPLTLTLA